MRTKQLLLFVLVLCFMLTFVSCKKEKKPGTFETVPLRESDEANEGNNDDKPITADKLSTVTGTFTFADLGQVKFEVYPQIAPQSALNFLYLAQNGCYNGTIVDRVQKGFTIEMGEFLRDFVEIEMPDGAYTIKGEFTNNGFENNLGVAEGIMMWCRNPEDPDSASLRFMICLDTAACQSLQGDYAAFGKITEGIEIIKKIGNRKVDENMRPKKTVVLLSVELDGDVTYPAPDMIRK